MRKIAGEKVDDVGDVTVDGIECGSGNLDSFIAERWLNAEIALHAHLRVRPRVREAQSQDLCLAFQRQSLVSDPVLHKFCGGVPFDEIPDFMLSGEEHLYEQGTVLIHDIQRVKHGQEVASRFRAVVWLCLLDSCPSLPVGVDALKGTRTPLFLAGPDISIKALGIGVNRERVPLTWLVTSREHKLPNEMVQRRSKVVDSIATKDAPSQRGCVEYWTKVHDVPSSIEGVIDGSSVGIRLKEGMDFAVERVKVFFSSADLGINSG